MEESRVIPIRQIMLALGFNWKDGEYIHTTYGVVVSEAYALDYMRDLTWNGEEAKVTRPSYSHTAIPCINADLDYYGHQAARFDKIYFEFKD